MPLDLLAALRVEAAGMVHGLLEGVMPRSWMLAT
jgi:hypothetical protein